VRDKHVPLSNIPDSHFTEKSSEYTGKGSRVRFELQTIRLKDPEGFEHRFLITVSNSVEGTQKYTLPAEALVNAMETFYQPMHKLIAGADLIEAARIDAAAALKAAGRVPTEDEKNMMSVGASAMLALLQASDELGR
jgi:hypothetical protein